MTRQSRQLPFGKRETAGFFMGKKTKPVETIFFEMTSVNWYFFVQKKREEQSMCHDLERKMGEECMFFSKI